MGKQNKYFRVPRVGLLAFVIGFVLISGFVAYRFFDKGRNPASPHTTTQSATENSQTEDRPTSIRLIATGDTIAHDAVNANARTGNTYDYFQFMENMQPYFDKADIRFCNQATPAGGTKFGVTGYPVFNAPFEFTHDLVKVGCNVVNLGTNHTYDKGQPLIDAMVGEWDKQGILAHAGANRSPAERDAVRYFEVQGLTFAFLSYAAYTNAAVANGYGLTMYSTELARTQLAEATEKADITIVSMRWGTEYSAGINERQATISQELANMGADIVLGHGQHVLGPVKQLKGHGGNDTLVWYGLGNFLNTQLDVETLTGAIAIMDIDIASKKITAVSALPIYMHYEWTAGEKAREDLLARHSLSMHPLDMAADKLARSHPGVSVASQTERIKTVLNRFTTVKILTSAEY